MNSDARMISARMSRRLTIAISFVLAIAALLLLVRSFREDSQLPASASTDAAPERPIDSSAPASGTDRAGIESSPAPAPDASSADDMARYRAERQAELEREYGRAPVFDPDLEEALRNPPAPVLPDNWDEILANPPELPPAVEKALNDPPPVRHSPAVEKILREQPEVPLPAHVRALMEDLIPVPPPPEP